MTDIIRVHVAGGPEVLSWESVDVAAPGPGEPRVRQTAIGINCIDVYHRSGLCAQPLPFTAGVEGAGIVEDVGPGVTRFRRGARVAYAMLPGSYAEAQLVPADRVIALPDDVSGEVAASMLLRGMTGNSWCGVVVRLVRAIGSCEPLSLALSLGADFAIAYRAPDWVQQVRELLAAVAWTLSTMALAATRASYRSTVSSRAVISSRSATHAPCASWSTGRRGVVDESPHADAQTTPVEMSSSVARLRRSRFIVQQSPCKDAKFRGAKMNTRCMVIAALLLRAPAALAQGGALPSLVSIRYASPAESRQVPASVRKDPVGARLSRSAAIQCDGNIIRGAFTAAKASDWAVLCSVRDTSQILIYRLAESDGASMMDSLESASDREWMQGIGDGRWGFSRLLRVRPLGQIRGWKRDASGQAIPQPIDHDAIEHVFIEKSGEAFYYVGWRRYRRITAD